MPQPTLGQVHVDRWLTNVAQKYLLDPGVFVYDQVFPVVPVNNQSDLVLKYDRTAFFRDAAEPRAPGKQSQGGGFTTSHDMYSCMQWAYHMDVPDEVRLNADSPMNLDSDATDMVTQVLRIRMERLWALRYFVAGLWTTARTGVAGAPGAGQVRQWDDYVNSTPMVDIRNIKLAMWMLTGYQPNTMAINKCTWYALRDHPTLVARLVFTQAVNKLTRAQVAALLDLTDIVVSESVYHRTPMGQSPVTMQPCLGRHALICYVPGGPSVMRPSAGYTFSWDRGNNGAGIVIRRIRFVHGEDKDRIEGRFYRDCKVLEPALGAFIQNVISEASCSPATFDIQCPPGLG